MKRFIYIALVLAVIAVAAAYYLWHKPHRTAENEKPEVALSADELLSQFAADEAGAQAKYLDKTIEVTGVVSEVKTSEAGEVEIVLATADVMETVNCILAKEQNAEGITAGTTVALKAICNGYLSLSGVNLNQGAVIKK